MVLQDILHFIPLDIQLSSAHLPNTIEAGYNTWGKGIYEALAAKAIHRHPKTIDEKS
jgi:hypothetical protein